MERNLQAAVKGGDEEAAKTLSHTIHHLSVQLDLQRHENRGLRASLVRKNKQKKHGKPLELHQRKEFHSSAVVWSPRKIREARAREAVRAEEEHKEELRKAAKKQTQKDNKLQRELDKEKRRLEQEKKKVERERVKAKKEAERVRKKAESDRNKALQLSQKGNNSSTRALASRVSKKKRPNPRRGRTASKVVQTPESPPPARTTKSGRTTTLPSKYR